jgi:hypothetical protein
MIALKAACHSWICSGHTVDRSKPTMTGNEAKACHRGAGTSQVLVIRAGPVKKGMREWLKRQGWHTPSQTIAMRGCRDRFRDTIPATAYVIAGSGTSISPFTARPMHKRLVAYVRIGRQLRRCATPLSTHARSHSGPYLMAILPRSGSRRCGP